MPPIFFGQPGASLYLGRQLFINPIHRILSKTLVFVDLNHAVLGPELVCVYELISIPKQKKLPYFFQIKWQIFIFKIGEVMFHLPAISFISLASIPSASARGIWRKLSLLGTFQSASYLTLYWSAPNCLDHWSYRAKFASLVHLNVCVKSFRRPGSHRESVHIADRFNTEIEPNHLEKMFHFNLEKLAKNVFIYYLL